MPKPCTNVSNPLMNGEKGQCGSTHCLIMPTKVPQFSATHRLNPSTRPLAAGPLDRIPMLFSLPYPSQHYTFLPLCPLCFLNSSSVSVLNNSPHPHVYYHSFHLTSFPYLEQSFSHLPLFLSFIGLQFSFLLHLIKSLKTLVIDFLITEYLPSLR